ncbi:MAG: 50S ribosomal protein L25 [Elusimicrobiota bacterium]
MESIIVAAEKREIAKKGSLNLLRKQGRIPAVIYGSDQEALPLSVDEKSFFHLIQTKGFNLLINLQINGVGDKTVLVKEIQRDYIKRTILHVDFHQISLREKIEVTVPLEVQGNAPGVKAGGVLEHILREIRVRCLPLEIPQSIKIDVSQLAIGQGILVKDLTLPEGLELLTGTEQIVINIVSPTVLEETPAVAVAAGAEPELITKGKKEEEGAEAGGAKESKESKESKDKKESKEKKDKK